MLGSRRTLVLAFTLLLAALVALDRTGLLYAPASDDLQLYANLHSPVTRIIDGDTIEILFPDPRGPAAQTRIRLWGIDCPELPRPGRKHVQRWAREAAECAAEFAQGRIIRLQLEPQRVRDKYGRVLAHVLLLEGPSLNEELLRRGLARADGRWHHSRMRRYQQIEAEAKRRGAGMWSDVASAAAAVDSAP